MTIGLFIGLVVTKFAIGTIVYLRTEEEVAPSI